MPEEKNPTAALGNPRLPYYLAAFLVLVTGGFAWFIYGASHPEPAAAPPAPAAALPASAPAAIPASAPAALPASAPAATLATAARPRKAAAKKPRSPATPPALPDPVRSGYRLLSEGRLSEAERDYLAALDQHPHDKDALLGLAVIAQRNRQTERAAELYRQVLREDIGNAAAAAGLVSLSVPADPVAAESQLRELIDIKPTAAELHYALGGVLADMQRWGEAQQAYFRAYSIAPDNALYAYNLAVCLDRLHQGQAALRYYRKAEGRDAAPDEAALRRRIAELSQAN